MELKIVADPLSRPGNDELDLIWGAEAIAREINRSMRQTFHLLETGALPAEKIGRRWCAMRSRLRKRFSGEGA